MTKTNCILYKIHKSKFQINFMTVKALENVKSKRYKSIEARRKE